MGWRYIFLIRDVLLKTMKLHRSNPNEGNEAVDLV